MKEEIRFIVDTIISISKLDRSECFMSGKIEITAESKGFFKKDRYLLNISNSPTDVVNNLFVKAIVNDKSVSCDIYKEIIIDILTRTGMLDAKLKQKFVWLKENFDVAALFSSNNQNQAGIAIASFKAHLAHSFPKVTGRIDIKSNKPTEISFDFKFGLEDLESLVFLQYGILLKSAISNCKKCGITQFVFIDSPNNQSEVLTIKELEKMDLK